ncbi:hypothetical protein V9K67_27070 [Paraflavisolibacter sp. H34]|uniref:hypothetical protein n=1 Tax=Huijunlia imazamoxiresistens TaxID=3127457 RepID=UPI003017B876
MALSRLILDIFDLAFDDYEYGDLLKRQIPFLSQGDQEHTGIGLFVYFNGEKGIEQYKVPTGLVSSFDIERNPIEMLNGVEMENEGLDILADITVHLKNGFIDCLEIFNKNGKGYPTEEPASYLLDQVWLDKSRRRTIVR